MHRLSPLDQQLDNYSNEIKKLKARVDDSAGAIKALQEELALKAESIKQLEDSVERVTQQLNAAEQRYEGLYNKFGSVLDDFESIKYALENSKKRLKPGRMNIEKARALREGVVSMPVETARSVLASLQGLYKRSATTAGLHVYGSYFVIDLDDPVVIKALPEGLSAPAAMEAFRRARLTKRITRDMCRAVGWDRIPPGALAIPHEMEDLTRMF